jgi:hypothetical protein
MLGENQAAQLAGGEPDGFEQAELTAALEDVARDDDAEAGAAEEQAEAAPTPG